MIKLFNEESLELLKAATNESVHSIVTDPPYGLGFMGKSWDKVLPSIEIWKECLRVLKPGGYIIAMSASRTYHRLAVQLEDLGFITHPQIIWIFGSGFPKATDLSKQFDKGVKREVIGKKTFADGSKTRDTAGKGEKFIMRGETTGLITAPATELAKKWDGWKYGLQSLKPALEPIYVGQKPWKNKYIKRMTENVEKYGVGAFNIDACRVEGKLEGDPNRFTKAYSMGDGHEGYKRKAHDNYEKPIVRNEGRHPANLLHDGSESVEKEFLKQGEVMGMHSAGKSREKNVESNYENTSYHASNTRQMNRVGDSGSASRFFNSLPITEKDLIPFSYIAKASKRERNEGLEKLAKVKAGIGDPRPSGQSMSRLDGRPPREMQNHHPTVKPVALMEWLVKLVTPMDGTCLDPFMGSGTTGIACKKNNFNFIGIEKEKEYFDIAKSRINQ